MNCSDCNELHKFVWFKVLLPQHRNWVQLPVEEVPLCFCPCPSASFTLKIWPLDNHGSQSGMGFYVLQFLYACTSCISWYPGNSRHLMRCFFKGSSQDTNVHILHWEVAVKHEVTHLAVPVYKAQTGLWLVCGIVPVEMTKTFSFLVK